MKEMERRARENSDSEDKRRYPSQMRRAEGPIPCEQCGLQLEDSRAYHGHFRRMHPDKNRTNYPSMKSPCMCEVCGRMFQPLESKIYLESTYKLRKVALVLA
ncbi:hypothetical protein B5X24_HaOG213373 [Helicoverpa armigera]|uniref:C2H2-type domain-containing protein n=1 Tax=Helicoverpa armigera TaxID=29058 RepID=A0A2W1B9M4_HELAM|nr:hypothetical protein B5X24_HaOG213373 [Helicoverpa armigera]